jgi:hypothetical protein
MLDSDGLHFFEADDDNFDPAIIDYLVRNNFNPALMAMDAMAGMLRASDEILP